MMLASLSPVSNADLFYSDFHSRIIADVSSISAKVNIDFEVITSNTSDLPCLRINFSNQQVADNFVKTNNLTSKLNSGLKTIQTNGSKRCI